MKKTWEVSLALDGTACLRRPSGINCLYRVGDFEVGFPLSTVIESKECSYYLATPEKHYPK
jgi:hypothetical protein